MPEEATAPVVPEFITRLDLNVPPLGPPDARQLFDDLFEAQWGLPKAKRLELLARQTHIGTLGTNEEATRAFEALVEAQKLDIAVAKIKVEAMVNVLRPQAPTVPVTASSLAEGVRRLLDDHPGDDVIEHTPLKQGSTFKREGTPFKATRDDDDECETA